MSKIADIINGHIADYDIEYRIHATQRMFRRDIHENDIESVLKNGEIIERYDDDFPLPSLLINGRASATRPLHLITAINHTERKIIIVTAYEPDALRWAENFSRRL